MDQETAKLERREREMLLLASAMCDGTATEADRDRLESLLHDDESLLESYMEYVTVHTALSRQWRGTRDPESSRVPPSTPRRAERYRNAALGMIDWRGHPVRFWLFAVTLSVLCWITFVYCIVPWHNMTDGDSATVATVTVSPSAEWVDNASNGGPEEAPEEVMELRENEMVSLRKGHAEIRYANGVRVTLFGRVDFQVSGANAGNLALGKIQAVVPTNARGFAVETPSATVTDLGTVFDVEVDKSGNCRVGVVRGSVEVATVGSGAAQRLAAGETLRTVQIGEEWFADNRIKSPEALERSEQEEEDVVSLPLVAAITVAVGGTRENPNINAARRWHPQSQGPCATDLFVRERDPKGSHQERRARLFLKFDTSQLAGRTIESAVLRLKVADRLPNSPESEIMVAKVAEAWNTQGNYPVFDQAHSGEKATGFNDDAKVGASVEADVTEFVCAWAADEPNEGLVLYFEKKVLVGQAYGDGIHPEDETGDRRTIHPAPTLVVRMQPEEIQELGNEKEDPESPNTNRAKE